MQILLFLTLATVLAYVLVQWHRILYYSEISARLVSQAKAQEAHPDDPSRSVLIIGDSLWAGVGAEDPADSLAGRLIADLPEALVVNQAESGARIPNGLAQLQEATDEYGAFDQIIIQLGANDILNVSDLFRTKHHLRELLDAAKEHAPDVAFMISGSIGFAPVFLLPLDWLYTWISRKYLSELSKISFRKGVLYIDLYRPRTEDPFYANPDKYYSADLFHPSGAGYGVWYQKCRENLQCFEYDEGHSKDGAAEEAI